MLTLFIVYIYIYNKQLVQYSLFRYKNFQKEMYNTSKNSIREI